MKFVKRFKTETNYNSYIESDGLILPNVSLIDEIAEMNGEDSGVRFNSLKITPDPANGYEYVDLGLPSGLKWAKCNIGAEKESDYGLYFAWGETVGYKNAKGEKKFRWDDYKYCDGSKTTLTKYNSDSSYGMVDNLTTLEPSDDAVIVNMGGSWRMPSKEEYQELVDNTTNTWTTINGVNGRLFTSKTNNNTLFFPASGFYWLETPYDIAFGGNYWNSSLQSSTPNRAYCMFFFDSDWCGEGDSDRYCGFPVRGVMD